MNIPAIVNAGDTWRWTDSEADYPASAGWLITYALWKFAETVVTIIGVANGDSFDFVVDAANTADVAAGKWRWTAYASKGAERYTIADGEIRVKPDLSAGDAQSDFRSTTEVMLANVEDAIRRLTAREVQSMSVNGRTVTYRDLGSLLQERVTLQKQVDQEKAAEAIAAGEDPGKRILVRFGSP